MQMWLVGWFVNQSPMEPEALMYGQEMTREYEYRSGRKRARKDSKTRRSEVGHKSWNSILTDLRIKAVLSCICLQNLKMKRKYKPHEKYIDSVMSRLCLSDSWLCVVVVMSRMGDGSHGRQPLRAAHGPAERAALRSHSTHAHQPPAAPASHHRPPRRRKRDCRHKLTRHFFFIFQEFSFFTKEVSVIFSSASLL